MLGVVKVNKQLFTLKADISANVFQKPSSAKEIFFITANKLKYCAVMVILYKGKMIERNNQILIKAVPIGKDLLKIGIREPRLASIDNTLVYLTRSLSK